MKQTKEIYSKKLYRTPKFQTYGNIRELTRAVDTVGERDMIGGGNNKT